MREKRDDDKQQVGMTRERREREHIHIRKESLECTRL